MENKEKILNQLRRLSKVNWKSYEESDERQTQGFAQGIDEAIKIIEK